MNRYVDRSDAGRQLALKLGNRTDLTGVVVCGLARGGVPVAYEVAVKLGVPLEVLVVRKLGLPWQREVAMGAIGEDGITVVEDDVIDTMQVSRAEFREVERRERSELQRRIEKYRGDRAPTSLVGRVAVIVDDGIATGATSRAACRVARVRGASRVILAAPMASKGTLDELRVDADEVVVLFTVDGSFSVGQWYDHFDETPDSEVLECLERASRLEERTE